LRQCKSTLAITLVDCLTCYDSIGHVPASIVCQHLGAPPSVLCTIFQTIQLMKFYLQTAYGDSNKFYGGGHSALLFQGVCQGNGVGPAIWLATTMVLMNMICANGNAVTFYSPISHQPTNLLRLLYMDDCDLFATNDNGLHPQAAITKLQKKYQLVARQARGYGRFVSTQEVLLVSLGNASSGHEMDLSHCPLTPSSTYCYRLQSSTPTNPLT